MTGEGVLDLEQTLLILFLPYFTGIASEGFVMVWEG